MVKGSTRKIWSKAAKKYRVRTIHYLNIRKEGFCRILLLRNKIEKNMLYRLPHKKSTPSPSSSFEVIHGTTL